MDFDLFCTAIISCGNAETDLRPSKGYWLFPASTCCSALFI